MSRPAPRRGLDAEPSPRAQPRVLMVATTYPRFENDHRPRFIADLCERLVADHGLRVTVVAPHGPGLERRETMRGVNIERFRYALDTERQSIAYGPGIPDNLRNLAAARRQVPGFVTAMAWTILRLLPRHDLIHAHWIPPAVVAKLANLWHRRPLVLTVHSLAGNKRLRRFAFRQADHVLFNSRYTLNQAVEQGYRFRGEVAYQGFDDATFGNVRRDGEIRRRLGIPERAQVVVAVARIVRLKGLHVLLASADAILDSRPDCHLVLVGDGPERPELERSAARGAHDRRIHFPGSLERADVARLLAEADLFVNPGIMSAEGRAEAFGVATVEAAACGLPAVGSRVGGIPETIEHDVTGLLVEPGEPEALAQAVGALLDDPERRFTMARAARDRAWKQFTWQALARKVMDVYHQLLTPTPARDEAGVAAFRG